MYMYVYACMHIRTKFTCSTYIWYDCIISMNHTYVRVLYVFTLARSRTVHIRILIYTYVDVPHYMYLRMYSTYVPPVYTYTVLYFSTYVRIRISYGIYVHVCIMCMQYHSHMYTYTYVHVLYTCIPYMLHACIMRSLITINYYIFY